MKTAQQIVDENFKGFDDIIEDPELREFYRDLIVTCMEGYSEAVIKKSMKNLKQKAVNEYLKYQ